MNHSFFVNFINKFNLVIILSYLILVPLFFSSVSIIAKIVLLFLLIIILFNGIYLCHFFNHKTFVMRKISAFIHLIFLFILLYCWLHTYFISKIPFESKIELVNMFLYITSFYIFYFVSKHQEITIQIKLSFLIVQGFLLLLYLFYKEKIIYFFVYNPNILSGYSTMCLLYCLAQIYEEKKMSAIVGINLILSTMFLVLLKSFTSWFVILLFFLFIVVKNFLILFFISCSLAICAIVLNPTSFLDRITWFFTGLLIWKDNFLFGIGMGNFKFFYPKYILKTPFLPSIATLFAHNYFIQTTAELGIVWLILFSLVIYTVVKNFKNESKKYLFPLCGILVQNIADYNLIIPQNSILFFIFLSLLLSEGDKKEYQCVTFLFDQDKYRYFLFIIIFFCLYSIVFSIKVEKTVRLCFSATENNVLIAVNNDKTCWQAYKQLAMYAIEHGEIDKAQQLLFKTLKYNPVDAETYFYLAVLNFRYGDQKNGYRFLSQAVRLNPRNAYKYVKQIRYSTNV